MNPRNGKIARLPRAVREDLNFRLEQAEPGPELLAWLNGLPETQAVLAAHFGGQPVSKQNLSQWRCGGYLDWFARRNFFDGLATVEGAADGNRPLHGNVMNRAVALLAGHYAGLLRGENLSSREAKSQARVLRVISRGIVGLRAGLNRSGRQAMQSRKLGEIVPGQSGSK